jgi:hypothetical protein
MSPCAAEKYLTSAFGSMVLEIGSTTHDVGTESASETLPPLGFDKGVLSEL